MILIYDGYMWSMIMVYDDCIRFIILIMMVSFWAN